MVNMENTEKIFADGFMFDVTPKHIQEKCPWIKGRLSIKANTAIEFIEKHKNKNGYLNIDLKVAKSGKFYLELNTYVKQGEKVDLPEVELGQIPF